MTLNPFDLVRHEVSLTKAGRDKKTSYELYANVPWIVIFYSTVLLFPLGHIFYCFSQLSCLGHSPVLTGRHLCSPEAFSFINTSKLLKQANYLNFSFNLLNQPLITEYFTIYVLKFTTPSKLLIIKLWVFNLIKFTLKGFPLTFILCSTRSNTFLKYLKKNLLDKVVLKLKRCCKLQQLVLASWEHLLFSFPSISFLA